MSEIKPVVRGKYIETQDFAEDKFSETKVYLADRELLSKSKKYAIEGRNSLQLMDEISIYRAMERAGAWLKEKREEIEKITAAETGIEPDALSYDMDLSIKILDASAFIPQDFFTIKRYEKEVEYKIVQGKKLLILRPSFFPVFSWTLKYIIAAVFLRTPVIIVKNNPPFYFYQELPRMLQEAGLPASAISFLPVKKEGIPEEIFSQNKPGMSFYLEGPYKDSIEKIFKMSFPFWPRRIFFSHEIFGEVLDIVGELKISSPDELNVQLNKADIEIFINGVNEKGNLLREKPIIIKGKCSDLPEYAPFYCLEPIDDPEEIEGDTLTLFITHEEKIVEILKGVRSRNIFVNRIKYHLCEISEIYNALDEISTSKVLVKP